MLGDPEHIGGWAGVECGYDFFCGGNREATHPKKCPNKKHSPDMSFCVIGLIGCGFVSGREEALPLVVLHRGYRHMGLLR